MNSRYVILALMQNPWFPPGTPERHIIAYRDDQAFHRRLLEGTMSGRRLKQAWGEEMWNQTWWDNANWRSASLPSGLVEPDIQHMQSVIDRIQPLVIVAIGRQAAGALRDCKFTAQSFTTHHPNARGRSQAELDQFGAGLQTYVRQLMQMPLI